MQNIDKPKWLSPLEAKQYLGGRRPYWDSLIDSIIIAAALSPRVRKRGELDREFVKRDITHLISPAAKVDIRLGRIKNPDPAGMSFERVLPLGRIENPTGLSFECVELEQHDLDSYAVEYHDFPPPQPEPSENSTSERSPQKHAPREKLAQISRAPNPIKPLRGAGLARANPAPTFDQEADWDEWANTLTGEAWQAVALSLNIEPCSLPGGPFDDYPAAFKRRLSIACNHAENGARWCTDLAPDTPRSTVLLCDFAAWAHSLGWNLPDPFRTRRKPGPKPPPQRDEAIRRRLEAGERPGENIPWVKFCDRLRDECPNSRLGDGRAAVGYSDRTIQRAVRSIQDEIARI